MKKDTRVYLAQILERIEKEIAGDDEKENEIDTQARPFYDVQ